MTASVDGGAGTANMRLQIDGLKVTLTVDGRVTVRTFETATEAGQVYDHFKARIVAAQVNANTT